MLFLLLSTKRLKHEYAYSGYGIGFDASSRFLFSNGERGKNIAISRVDNSFVPADNKKRYLDS